MSVNSRLKAISIIGQRKASYRQRIPESSCARKETIDIDILVTSRNGDRKIMQSIRITSRPPSRIRKWNQLSQFRWTSTKVIPIGKTEAGDDDVEDQKALLACKHFQAAGHNFDKYTKSLIINTLVNVNSAKEVAVKHGTLERETAEYGTTNPEW